MNQEHAELLINRAIDGIASRQEREQLASALRADPLLRSEFEEMQSVHASTESLFRQLALPQNFSARIMRRVQGDNIPADDGLESIRLPSHRRSNLAAAPVVTATHRRRARVYAIIASISAAAAMLLALGVFTGFFARSGIGTADAGSSVSPDGKEVADGRQGGPDTEEINRTVSSPHQPLVNDGDTGVDTPKNANDSKGPPAPKGEGQPDLTPKPEPEEVVKNGGKKTGPESPASEPKNAGGSKVGGDLVDGAKPAPTESPKEIKEEPESPAGPGHAVDVGPKAEPKTEDPTHATEAPARVLLGRVAGILSGRVEISSDQQNWTRISENQELHEGDYVRTKVNGTALLLLDSGSVTLDRQTLVSLKSSHSLALQEGIVALDRESTQHGDLDLICEDYTLHLSFGCAVVERKRRGLSVQKAVGFASLSHDEFGSVLLDTDSGYTIEAEFGKVADEPKSSVILLPDWSGEARSQLVMLGLDSALSDREFAVRERSYVTSRLPGGVEKLTQFPTTTGSVRDFLKDAIGNEKLNGAAIIKLVGEVQVAYSDVTELTPDVINGHAGRAALVAEDYDQWRDYFWRLMRPPVQPKTPPAAQPSSGETDCPLEKDKLKRVDNPPRKPIVKKVPPQSNDTPEQEPENKN